jgi:hypothetical protein
MKHALGVIWLSDSRSGNWISAVLAAARSASVIDG